MGKPFIKYGRYQSKPGFIDLVKKIIPSPMLASLLTAIIFLVVTAGAIFYYQLHGFSSYLIFSNITSRLITPEKTRGNNLFKREVIGFLPSWTVAKGALVDPKNLTQIIYFGLGVNDIGELIKFGLDNKPTLEWANLNSDYFKDLVIRAHKNGVKVLLSVKNFDNENIDGLISNEALTSSLTKQLSTLVDDFNLDGINIDFEYYTDSNFPTNKYLNNFFGYLKTNLKKSHPGLIISVDISVSAVEGDRAYDIVKIGDSVDQLILMGYDYSGVSSSEAGPVSPLYSSGDTASISKTIDSLTGRINFNKVILAVPFYGYEWQTQNKNFKSPTIENSGALATYQRINQLIRSNKEIKVNWDEISQTPWLIYEQSGAIKQIYYEDAESLAKKLEFIGKNHLAGVAIWALGYEGETGELWQTIQKYNR